jgi:EAL domain-containing protein (putative c-di-GMP-specific phosphodiesterase class I)
MLGSNLGLTVIAEGVETEAQRAFLQAEGCNLYQGYLYSPALTSAQFEAFVGASSTNTLQRLQQALDNEDPAVLNVEAA